MGFYMESAVGSDIGEQPSRSATDISSRKTHVIHSTAAELSPPLWWRPVVIRYGPALTSFFARKQTGVLTDNAVLLLYVAVLDPHKKA